MHDTPKPVVKVKDTDYISKLVNLLINVAQKESIEYNETLDSHICYRAAKLIESLLVDMDGLKQHIISLEKHAHEEPVNAINERFVKRL